MIEAEIDRFIVEGQYSLAVILSQTMLELLVEREVRGLAEGLPAGSFGEATLELHAFLGHNRLRNRIVHEGANAGHEEAVASPAAVRGITARLHEIVARRTVAFE